MHRSASSLFLLLALVAIASARTITWTGGAGNSLWHFASNWDANAVPAKDDDVVVNTFGGSSISISQPATARSITIGGGSYRQTLTLLSSLAVGDGGIAVKSFGTLTLSGNNDLPLSSVGAVTAAAGGTIIFQSGDIQGPGRYIIQYGAYIEFSGAAQKTLEGASLIIQGAATIQPTSILLEKSANITSTGDITVIGQVTIFSLDNSRASFNSFGNFSYNSPTNSTGPLTFQLDTFFAGDLDIKSGTVIIADNFTSNGDVSLPQGTVLNIQAGPKLKYFRNIEGAGSFNVYGYVEASVVAVSWLTIADSGSLTLYKNSTAKSLSVAGKLIVDVGLTATDATLSAGTITGAGRVISTGNFEIAVSASGSDSNFISARVEVRGKGFLTGKVYLLLADLGYLDIFPGATFRIAASANFGKQSGSPAVNNNGTFTLDLPVGSTFHSNVDYFGNGALTVNSGDVTFEANQVSTKTIFVGPNALIHFISSVVNVSSSTTGTGSVNLTAQYDVGLRSHFGDVAISYFGVISGDAYVRTLSLNTFEIFDGAVYLTASTINKATIFNIYGGEVNGQARITSAAVTINAKVPVTLDGVVIDTAKFNLRAGTDFTLIAKNNAQINVSN